MFKFNEWCLYYGSISQYSVLNDIYCEDQSLTRNYVRGIEFTTNKGNIHSCIATKNSSQVNTSYRINLSFKLDLINIILIYFKSA